MSAGFHLLSLVLDGDGEVALVVDADSAIFFLNAWSCKFLKQLMSQENIFIFLKYRNNWAQSYEIFSFFRTFANKFARTGCTSA